MIAALTDLGVTALSGEAEAAMAAFRAVHPTLESALYGCASGRELAAAGFDSDVEVSGEYRTSDSVPVLTGGAFRPM